MSNGGPEILNRLQADLANARRSQDKDRLMLLGMMISEIRNREIELRRDLTDEDAIDTIGKAVKRRREAVEMYQKASREDLSSKEAREAEMLAEYLPVQANPEQLRAAVKSAIAGGATNVGAIMAQVMPSFKGRADGKSINAMAREELSRG